MRYTFALDDRGGYEVADESLGVIGRLGRVTSDTARGHTRWQPVSQTGVEGPIFDARHPAAVWLHVQVDPEYFKPRVQPDPVLNSVRRYVSLGDDDQALRTVLEHIRADLDDMRGRRRTHPAALWRHLDRYSTWLAAAGVGEEPATDLPARLAHLRAVEVG